MEYIGEISMLSSINEGRKNWQSLKQYGKKKTNMLDLQKTIKQQKQKNNFLKILYEYSLGYNLHRIF